MAIRWFCAACRREWLHARQWNPEDGCPACHAPAASVTGVEYRPAFMGADLPRDADGNPARESVAPAPVWLDVPPAPMALTQDDGQEDYAAITG